MTNDWAEQSERDYIQFCADILITGVEGGIDYWIEGIDDYRWDCDGKDVQVYITWAHDDNSNKSYYERMFLNWETVHNGLKHILSDTNYDTLAYAYGWRQRWIEAIINRNAGEFDVSDADEIIQAGIFEKKIYG